MPQPGRKLGRQKARLTLFGQWFDSLCQYLDASWKDVALRAEVDPTTISKGTREGQSSPNADTVERLVLAFRSLAKEKKKPWEQAWEKDLFNGARLATHEQVQAADKDLEIFKQQLLGKTQNAYLIDTESRKELDRLVKQSSLITRGLGGPLSEQEDITLFADILDVACGPGGWCLDVGRLLPTAQITGVDISHLFLTRAQERLRSHRIENITFRIMDVTQPLNLDDNSFDLVNARMLHGFLGTDQWIPLLKECVRVLRPGGILRLTEDEMPFSNKAAFERLSLMSSQAFKSSGKSFSPDGRRIGITAELKRLLKEAGCVQIQSVSHDIDVSADSVYHDTMALNLRVAYKLAQPFLIKHAHSSLEEQDTLLEQMSQEMDESDFSAFWFFLTAWGRKPE